MFNMALLFLLFSIFLSGCWDRTEINDLAFVMGTAIDKEKDGYQVSVLIPLPGNMGGPSGGEGSGKRPFTIQTETGSTQREALDKMQRKLSRRLFLAHRRVLLLGEDLMGEDLSIVLDATVRSTESRLTTLIGFTKGKASDLLGADVKMERFAIEAAREILKSESTIFLSLKKVFSDLYEEGIDALIPYLETVETHVSNEKTKEINPAGYVLTRNGRGVGILTGDHANALHFLKKEFNRTRQVLRTENASFSITVDNTMTVIKPYLEGDDVHFDVLVTAEGHIVEEISPTKMTYKSRQELKELWSRKLESDINQLIEILKSYKSDVVGFGKALQNRYPEKWKSEWGSNWAEHFSKSSFHVSVKTNIDRFGLLEENLKREESFHDH
jgi:Ger(x)C family germination protein